MLPKLKTHQPDVSDSIAVLSWACFLLLPCKSWDKSASAPLLLAWAAPVLSSWDLGWDLRLGYMGIARCAILTMKVLLLPHTKYKLKYLKRSAQIIPPVGHATFEQVGSGGRYNSVAADKSSVQGSCPGLSCMLLLQLQQPGECSPGYLGAALQTAGWKPWRSLAHSRFTTASFLFSPCISIKNYDFRVISVRKHWCTSKKTH